MSRILPYFLVVLIAVMLYLSYSLYTAPALADRELILNEESYYRTVNRAIKDEMCSIYDYIFDRKKSGRNPRMIACREAFEEDFNTYALASGKFFHAFSSRYEGETTNEELAQVKELVHYMLNNPKTYSEGLSFPPIEVPSLRQDGQDGLHLLMLENSMISAYTQIVDRYGHECQASIIFHHTLEEVLGMDIGRASIHDSVEVWIPHPMKVNVQERARITFSKKFVDKLLDSLRRENVIPDSMHHAYKAFVKVAGKDIEVESFDSVEKGVSPYTYTNWEFDLGAHSGTPQLSIAIGIATTDSDSTESIAWVTLPVKPLVVIK